MHFHVLLQEALYCVISRFDNNYFVIVAKLNFGCTHTVQFRFKLNFALFLYHSLNFCKFLKKSFSIEVIGDVAQKLSKNLAKF